MKIKNILTLCAALLFASVLSAQVSINGCTSCTNGVLVSVTGDLAASGSMTIAKGYVNTSTTSPFSSLTYAGSQTKVLVESVATTFVSVTVPTGASGTGNAAGYITYQIYADDTVDFQSRTGLLLFTIVNKAGTLTCSLGRAQGSATVDNTTDIVAATGASTLTNTFTCVDAGSGVAQIKANATSSLTQTTLNIRYQISIPMSGTSIPTVTPG